MALSEKKKASNARWDRQNYKRIGVKLYKSDAAAFEEYCNARGLSVNAALREYVAACIGRPLEKRTRGADQGDDASAPEE